MKPLIALLLLITMTLGCRGVLLDSTRSVHAPASLTIRETDSQNTAEFVEEGARVPFRPRMAVLWCDEIHPCGECLLGKCDRERCSPQLLDQDRCCNNLVEWCDGSCKPKSALVWERLVGRKRNSSCYPLTWLMGLNCSCKNPVYGAPKSPGFDFQVVRNAKLFFVLSNPAKIDGLRVKNDDVVAYDGENFARLIHGEDIGLAQTEIDGFAILNDREFLFSFAKEFQIDEEHPLPGLSGVVDDSDILLFRAESLGEISRGTFEIFVRGSDLGLTTDDEDIDAISVSPTGNLLVSTVGDATFENHNNEQLTADDEDIVEVSFSESSNNEKPKSRIFLDVSDLKITSLGNDLDALAIEDGEFLLFSMRNLPTNENGNRENNGSDTYRIKVVENGANSRGEELNRYLGGSELQLNDNDIAAIEVKRFID